MEGRKVGGWKGVSGRLKLSLWEDGREKVGGWKGELGRAFGLLLLQNRNNFPGQPLITF